MWTKTLEREIQVTLSDVPQSFHQLVFYKALSESASLRLNVQSTNGEHKALLHHQNDELDDVFSRLVYQENSCEPLELFVQKIQTKAERFDLLSLVVKQTSTRSNWKWDLLDSEFTEFGLEETWRARWRKRSSKQLKKVELQVHWFHGTLKSIPSFVSVEVMRIEPNTSIELYSVELPIDAAASVEENQGKIERKVEDMLVTPMDLMVHLMLT